MLPGVRRRPIPVAGPGRKSDQVLGQAPPEPIELWDNDGIVNTASMLWPKGETVLVPADHLDIVGHYKLVKVAQHNRGKDDYERPAPIRLTMLSIGTAIHRQNVRGGLDRNLRFRCQSKGI